MVHEVIWYCARAGAAAKAHMVSQPNMASLKNGGLPFVALITLIRVMHLGHHLSQALAERTFGACA